MSTQLPRQKQHHRRHQELIRRHTRAAMAGLCENIELHGEAYKRDNLLRESLKFVLIELMKNILQLVCQDDHEKLPHIKRLMKANLDSMYFDSKGDIQIDKLTRQNYQWYKKNGV